MAGIRNHAYHILINSEPTSTEYEILIFEVYNQSIEL